jgi:dUTP pyrophosphatase
MRVKALHPNFRMPTKGTDGAGAFDIYMPVAGSVGYNQHKTIPLGFAAEVPPGYVALLLPRSGAGAKHGLELNNTCGVIDSDYRGEWKAVLRTKSPTPFLWNEDDRVLQFLLVPVLDVRLEEVSEDEELTATGRGVGGFGSTGG